MYRSQIVSLPQQFQAPGPKTAPAYGSHFEHRHAFQQRLIEEQRQQLQKQRERILELQENQRLSRAKEESAQATAVTQPLNNSASQTREEKLKSEKQSGCKNTTLLRYMPSVKQAQLVSMCHSYSSWARICQAHFSHASAICSSSHLWLGLKGGIRLATILRPPFLQWLNTMWSIQDPLRNSNTRVSHIVAAEIYLVRKKRECHPQYFRTCRSPGYSAPLQGCIINPISSGRKVYQGFRMKMQHNVE